MKKIINIIMIAIALSVTSVMANTNGPNLTIFAPADWSTTTENNIDVYGSAWDSDGVMMVTVNGEYANASTSWFKNISLAVGTNPITVIAYDYLSNSTTEIIYVVRTGSPGDITPPIIAIQSPADGTVSTVQNVIISGIANDNVGLASVTVNGSSVKSLTNWIININLAEGDNLITAIATDNSGNSTIDTITVVYLNDTTSPTINSVSPPNGYSTYDSSVNMTILAHDNIELTSVKVNGADAMLYGSNEWIYTANLIDGANWMTISAEDAAGNTTKENVVYTRQIASNMTIFITIPTEEPEYKTTNSLINIGGIIFSSDQVGSVVYSSSSGQSGSCSLLSNDVWFAPTIGLSGGENLISVTAFHAFSSNVFAQDEIMVKYLTQVQTNPPPNMSPVIESFPPTKLNKRYTYDLKAFDADGDSMDLRVITRPYVPTTITKLPDFDPWVRTWRISSVINEEIKDIRYKAIVTDVHGANTRQLWKVKKEESSPIRVKFLK